MEKIDLPSLSAVFFSYGTFASLTQVHFQAIQKALGGQKAKTDENEWQACRNYTTEAENSHHVRLLLAKLPQEQDQYYIEIAYTLGHPERRLKASRSFSDALKDLEKIPAPLSFFVNAEFRYPTSEPTVVELPMKISKVDFTEIRGLTLVKLLEDNKTFSYSIKAELLPQEIIRCLVNFREDSTFSKLSPDQLLREARTISKKFFKPKEGNGNG